MTDETKDNPIKEIVDSLNSSMAPKLDTMLNEMKQKLETMVPPKQEVSEPVVQDDGDDDTILTKKDLKAFAEKLLERTDRRMADVVSQSFAAKSEKDLRDVQAFKDFPMIDNNSAYFDSEFSQAVRAEAKRRIDRGRKADDPDLVYDAAATVKAINPKWAMTQYQKAIDEQRELNNQQSMFGIKGNSSTSAKKPSEYQLDIAKRVGISPEKLEKRMKEKNY